MFAASCVILVPDDTARTGRSLPLLLEPVMGCPLLGWLGENLLRAGIQRFFLVCHPQYASAVRACMPRQAEVQVSANQAAPDLLHVFLSTADEAEEEVLVVSGPAMLVPAGAPRPAPPAPGPVSRVFRTGREALMQALDDSFSFAAFLQEEGVPLTAEEGAYRISSAPELAQWQSLLQAQRARALIAAGVRIWDEKTVCVEPGVTVAAGTELLPGTVLRGRTSVGADCVLGPNVTVRDTTLGDGASVVESTLRDAVIGPGAHIGPHCAVSGASTLGSGVLLDAGSACHAVRLGDGVHLFPHTWIADAKIGEKTEIGPGAVTSGAGVTIGQSCAVGARAVLLAPLTMEDGAAVAPGAVATGECGRSGKTKHIRK